MSTLRAALGSAFLPLLLHNHNQQQSLQRAAQAKASGLDPAAYGTVYPGSTVTTTNNNQQAGWLKGALLGAALLAGGGAGAAALTGALSGAGTPTATSPAATAPQQPSTTTPPGGTQPPAAAGKGQAWDAVYRQRQPDGSWKVIKRQPLQVPQ